ncbi:hypothetical protein Ccrd_005141 [Cynara cardunculus var. scolymus]|uniref:Uncharacterized protein n=1 Tax=Cynara cardunculus var. scolymus TaxID=59895 RepID=A0A118JV90_CYNCS|nr:hypothetical protein Ccrd_005141 [Cynara cardunculus var. scolymus]
MAMASNFTTFRKLRIKPQMMHQIFCRKKEKGRDQNYPYKVIEVTPPPRNLGVRCFPPRSHTGTSFEKVNTNQARKDSTCSPPEDTY